MNTNVANKIEISKMEEDLFENAGKLNFNNIKTYTSYIKNNYSEVGKEKLYRIIECLNKDTRKNVLSLAESLRKFIEKNENEISRMKDMYEFDK
ncbi:MAG: ribonuclease HII, partial [Clostridiaceae bacterium]|nr:ribonuclease HII [Clostridiaceae bacterium]